MGPSGMFASRGRSRVSYNGASLGEAGAVRTGSVMTATMPGLPSRYLSHQAGQHGDRNRDVAERQHDRGQRREIAQQSVGSIRVPAEGLKHAPDTVPQVQTDGNHCEYVKEHHYRLVKAGDHVVVNVAVFVARIDRAEREVEQVIDDEQQNEQAAVDHRPAREGGLEILSDAVSGRATCVVSRGQLDGCPDVDDERRNKDDSGEPKQLAEAEEGLADGAQKTAVVVEEGWSGVDLEIAPEMDDQIAEPDQARDGHHVFLADRRAPEGSQARDRPASGEGSVDHWYLV